MTLNLLVLAIRPQFAWLDTPFKKLKTCDKSERYQGFGPMVFIGIADSFDIPKTDVMDYLEIKSPEYESKLSDFHYYLEEIRIRKEAGTLYKYKDFTDRAHSKIKLTLHALNTLHRGITLHSTLHL